MLAMSPEVNSFDHEIEETEEILSNTAKRGGGQDSQIVFYPFDVRRPLKKKTPFFSFFCLDLQVELL